MVQSRARGLIVTMALLCLAASLVATARLAASVAATPQALLLVEPVRYVEPDVAVDAGTVARADRLAAILDDPGFIRARISHCRVAAGEAVDAERCIAAIDDALRGAPSSGELWLLKASLLAEFGEFGDPLLAALRNSFAMTPREGWIAVPRVGLELRLYPFLSAELKEQAKVDLGRVLADSTQAHDLAAEYARDPIMRDAGKPAFDEVPPELVSRFVAYVRDAAEQAAAAQPPQG